MLTVRSVAAVLHKVDLTEVTAGQIRGLGRSLKVLGIPTKRKGGITYIDLREGTTAEGVIRKMAQKKKERKAQLKLGILQPMTPAIPTAPGPILYIKPGLATVKKQSDLFQDVVAAEEYTVDALLRTIAGQAEAMKKQQTSHKATIEDYEQTIADQHSIIQSLREQLDVANNKLLNETVKKAIAVYGKAEDSHDDQGI